jgi:hypothetical protein
MTKQGEGKNGRRKDAKVQRKTNVIFAFHTLIQQRPYFYIDIVALAYLLAVSITHN